LSKTRFEAFSDGVFAFAITLLVLGFALPVERLSSNRSLALALLALWPNLVAYALSFGVIGIMWQNHHALFRRVASIDRTTIFWNLALLGGTVFIPFATSTLGRYPTMSAAAFLYGLTLSETSTCYNLMLSHLVRSRAFEPSLSAAAIAATIRAYRTGWITYSLATLLGLIFPIASFAAYLGIVGYYLFPHGIESDLGA
jgi:uncharacterized membrane protein